MSQYQSALLQCLHERGFLYQCTEPEALDALAASDKLTAYIGFDLTADSLHVGSLVQIMLLKWLQVHGHRPVVVLGGGTTKIGDPSGKDSARKMLNYEKIAENKASIKKIFEHYLGVDENKRVIVDNATWLDYLSYVELLRDVGPHFSVNRMLSFESVKSRLDREQNLSFLEFNYMILQAYDFVELAKRYGCQLQMGGSDQWGNIVSGIELGRKITKKSLYGLTAPLLTTSSGAKMGKTADGAVWLSQEKLPAYDFWQYWRNVEDLDVVRFFKLFTLLPLEEIQTYEKFSGGAINEAKVRLANEVTTLCHGQEAAQRAEQTAKDTFTSGGMGVALPSLDLARYAQEEGVLLTRVLCDLGFSQSNSEARRLILAGAVKLADGKVEEVGFVLKQDDFAQSEKLRLTVGKKKIAVLTWLL